MSTPRTDAVAKRYETNEIGAAEVLIYARELERENAELKAVSDEPTSGLCAYIEYLRRRNMEVKIERNRYKVALQDIADAAGFDNIGKWARNKARATLEKEAQP